MSLQQVLTFAASSTTAIAPFQAPVAATPLYLNGSPTPIAVPFGTHTSTSYTIPNVSRILTLTSVADLSTVNFVFKGLDINMNPVGETLAGPNNNTVGTANNYHVLLSITPSATNAGTVSVGTGPTGTTQWVTLDNNRSNSQLTLLQVVVTGTITYTVNGTTDRIQYPTNTGGAGGSGIVTPTLTPNPIAAFTGKSATVIAQEDLPYSGVEAVITASTGGSLVFTILQPGLD